MSKMKKDETLLTVRDLKTVFKTPQGIIPAVDGVFFEVKKGHTLGIVGESGCGKSVTALSILRLVPSPPGKIVSGSIIFDGMDLLKLGSSQMRRVRGKRIAMIFQEPMTSLNPVFTIGNQIREMFSLHQPHLSRGEVTQKIIELLDLVGIPDPQQRLDEYPHQFSGGMRQRVMIAIALSCSPDLLIADEPTTALDVTIQAQILELIKQLQQKLGMAVILITHDFGVVAEMADEVGVMYAGSIIEYGSCEDIFLRTQHPYTYGLLKSVPRVMEVDSTSGQKHQLYAIPGNIPELTHLPLGCRFAPRCQFCVAACEAQFPKLDSFGQQHVARCIRPRLWEK